MDYEPGGTTEKIGDALGAMTSRVEGDLERFKKFVERREEGSASGPAAGLSAASRLGQAGSANQTERRLGRVRLAEAAELVLRGIRRGAREVQAKGLQVRKDREIAALGKALYPLLRSGQVVADVPEVRARMSRLEELE